MTQEDSTKSRKRTTQRGNPPKALIAFVCCPGCAVSQPRSAFQKDRRAVNGLRMPCKECIHALRPQGTKRKRSVIEVAEGFSLCNRCGEVLPLSDFYKQPNRKRGVAAYCKACNYIVNRANPKIRTGLVRSHFKRRYGMTLEERAAMIAEQDGRCSICADPFTTTRSTHLDHDHTTGNLRAVLCRRCNLTLGFAHDDPDLLRKMADYIEYHKQEY